MSAADELIAGRYRLVRRVGTGGMGVVWEGWDERLHRKVAVKQLHAQHGVSAEEAELSSLRAMREARITARLDHPHAVPVFDVVEHEGQPCLIMQFLPSTPLSVVLRERHTLALPETARIGAQIASALAAAHRAGIVHRDVKPGNVLLAEDGTARISDFGISHALGDATLTMTGMVHGTPAYLAPEVARGADSTFASDVFGLGATLYTASEGAPPFGKDQNSIALLYKVASGNFTPPTRSGPLTPLLERMLAPDPASRPDMGQVARELTQLASESGAEPDTLKFAEGDVATVVNPASATQRLPTQPAAVEPVLTPMTATSTTPTSTPPTPPTATPAPPSPTRSVAATPEPPGSDWTPPERRLDTEPRRGRSLLAVLLAVAALLGVGVLAYTLLPSLHRASQATAAPQGSVSTAVTSGGAATAKPTTSASTRSPTSSASQSPTGSSSSSSPATSTSTGSASTSSSGSSSSSSSSSSSGSSSSASATTSQSPSNSTSPSAAGGSPSANQLRQAVVSYYALMPGQTDAGWARLTPSYQRGQARNRQTYDRFWAGIKQVSLSRVRSYPPDRVTADVRYRYSGGRTVRERTSFQLVDTGQGLQINNSTVLSSSGG